MPAGTPEIAAFGLASTAKYSISGIADSERSIEFGSDSFRQDPLSGLNVGVSRGATSYHNGTSMPQARPGCLSETHELFVYYPENTERIDHETNMRVGVGAVGANGAVFKITVVASSAIIGVAGSGHLALGYPTTSTFTQATSPEETTIQLRTYLGSYISSPESILVLPNVFIDGVVSIAPVGGGFNFRDEDQAATALTGFREGARLFSGPAGVELGRVYQGTTFAAAANPPVANPEPTHINQGPLGILDKINGLATIHGGISTMPMEL